MKKDLVLDERELKEIHHSIHYRDVLAHGTVGHNLLMLVGKMADAWGFEIDENDNLAFYADSKPYALVYPKGSLIFHDENPKS